MVMPKTPDDDLYCTNCQSVNVRLESEGGNNYRCVICSTKFLYVKEDPFVEIEKDEKLTTFPSGATRSSDADNERYDLCPSIWAKRDAIIMAEGAKTHGADNWKRGIPISVCLNHLERHLNLWKSGNTDEDHLAKIRVNAGFIMYFEEENLNVRDANSTEDDVIIAEFDYKYPRHKSPSNNETY